MDEKKIPYVKGPAKYDHSKNKILTKKSRRRRTADGTESCFIQTDAVSEDKWGNKFKHKKLHVGDGYSDYRKAKAAQRGQYDGEIPGDYPRNLSPKFKENYNQIKGFEEKEKTSNGVPVPKRTKKVYK